MKKKKSKAGMIILIILVIVEGIVIGLLVANSNKSTSSTTTTVSEVNVSTQTIEKTLTASSEVATSSTENLTLSTSKYFKTMCVEENDEVKTGENILEYTDGTYLTATYDCLVSTYSVPATGSICTSSNYVTVENLDTLQLSLSVDESEISNISKGQEVQITISALDDKKYTGTITKVNELGTYSSSGSTFTATVQFTNDGNVKLGMSASCTVVLQKVENVIAVPIAAVQTKKDEKYVVVVNTDGTTTNTTITTGVSNDEYVEVKSGLSGNETVQKVTTSTTNTSSSSSSKNSSSSLTGGSSSGGMQQQSSGGMGQMGGGTPPSGGM